MEELKELQMDNEFLAPEADDHIHMSLQKLLDLRLQTRGMSLLSRKTVSTWEGGEYHSSFRGRGIDFSEVRPYQLGDDIRLMDWRVTARTGEAHIKIFQEERERPVLIVVDQGPSMFFGTRVTFKSSIAAMAAALTAWVAVQGGDKVGGLVFAGEETFECRPRARKYGILPFLKILDETTKLRAIKDDPYALEKAFIKLRHVAKPGSLIFIYSDFTTLTPTSIQQLGFLAKYCEIRAGYIMDRLEAEPPKPDFYALTNGEQIFNLDMRSREAREKYQRFFSQRYLRIESDLLQYRIPLLKLTTETDIPKRLQRAFINWKNDDE